nr:hypothetical protein Q903MT_gene2231 [Picea sitchensis]
MVMVDRVMAVTAYKDDHVLTDTLITKHFFPLHYLTSNSDYNL